MHATLLIGGTVLELDPPRVEQRDIVMHGSVIGDVSVEIPTTSTINCTDCLIMPGLVIGHTHLYAGLAGGYRGSRDRLARALDERSLRSSVQAAAIAAIRSGATCLVDHHQSPSAIDGSLDVVADVISDLGLRGLLAYGATDEAGLAESERFARKARTSATVRGAIGLAAPYRCSDETIASARDRAKAADTWLHMHVAEEPRDQIDAKARWGARTIHHLDAIGCLGKRALLAHATDVSQDEGGVIRERGSWVLHQARADMSTGAGHASSVVGVERALLGTDGLDHDLVRELQAAFLAARGHDVEPPRPTELLARGHRLASQIFGASIGPLATGAAADLTVVSYEPSTPLDAETLDAHLVYGFGEASVRDVFVSGRAVMRNRRIVGIDDRAVMFAAREEARRLWERAG
jgi:cytosine/adenosine deaminase-related metal-dependent hydrolase